MKRFGVALLTTVIAVSLSVPVRADPIPPPPPPPPPGLPVGLSPSMTLEQVTGNSASLGNPYGCYGQSDQPHESSHVPNTVAAHAKTECLQQVPRVYVTAQLWKYAEEWILVGAPAPVTQYNWYRADVNPSAPCSGSGYWYFIFAYHEVTGTDGQVYSANTGNEWFVPC
jgi:hypothetical protein